MVVYRDLATDTGTGLLDDRARVLVATVPGTEAPRTLLPDNATPLMLALSETFAERVAALPPAIGIFEAIDPLLADHRLLEHLAWEWSVDDWDPDWSDETKRRAITASWGVHSIKGTFGALERAVAVLGLGARVAEWFETSRPPYTFRLAVDDPQNRPWGARDFIRIQRTAVRAKNVRSFIEAIDLDLPGSTVPVFVGAVVAGRITVSPNTDAVTAMAAQASSYVGAAYHARLRISPKPV